MTPVPTRAVERCDHALSHTVECSDGSDSDVPSSLTSSASTCKSYPRTGKRGAPQAFAHKLYEILEDVDDLVIAWNPAGKSFTIHDMDRFVEEVLHKYFRHRKYSSFQRQLNLYGFRKVIKGSGAGSYYHTQFMKDRKDLLRFVRRSSSQHPPSTRNSSSESFEPSPHHEHSQIHSKDISVTDSRASKKRPQPQAKFIPPSPAFSQSSFFPHPPMPPLVHPSMPPMVVPPHLHAQHCWVPPHLYLTPMHHHPMYIDQAMFPSIISLRWSRYV